MSTDLQPARRTTALRVRTAVVNSLVGSPLLPPGVRTRVLRLHGCRLHPSVVFGPRLRIPYTTDVVAEAGVFVNGGCIIEGYGRLELAAQATVAVDVRFLTTTHELGPSSCRAGAMTHATIHVGAGAWIGAGAIVLPGVRIGSGAVVGAGAVVTRDVPDDCVYAGSPARLVRHL